LRTQRSALWIQKSVEFLRTSDAEQEVRDEPDAHPEQRLPGLGREEEDPSGPGEEHRPHQELEYGPGQRRQRADRRGALGRRIAADRRLRMARGGGG
jgi:hypothetical protein